jgi:hypothetical protein
MICAQTRFAFVARNGIDFSGSCLVRGRGARERELTSQGKPVSLDV